jgi:hypothetical protein
LKWIILAMQSIRIFGLIPLPLPGCDVRMGLVPKVGMAWTAGFMGLSLAVHALGCARGLPAIFPGVSPAAADDPAT